MVREGHRPVASHPIWMLCICGFVVLALGPALPVVAEEWLRLDAATTGQGLWVDLEAKRYGPLGTCDAGRPLEDLQRTGRQVEIRIRELMQGDLTAGRLSVEQTSNIRVEGDRGTLRVRAVTSGELVEVPLRVTWTRGRRPPGCGA